MKKLKLIRVYGNVAYLQEEKKCNKPFQVFSVNMPLNYLMKL